MIATALSVAFVIISCKGKLDVANKLDLEDTPMQTVDDMFVVHSENGILKMRMEATLMERYDKDTLTYELFPKGFNVYSYSDEGKLETHIVSDNARHEKYSDGRESWSAFGNVVITNVVKQEIMETDTLYWDQKNEKLYTDCYVRMYSPSGLMQGYGMESDQKTGNSIILKPFNNYALLTKDTTRITIDTINFIGPFQKK